jgi:peptide/nickel transport system ATP-binding protein
MNLLSIENLKTYYFTKAGAVKAVDGVTLSLNKGQSIGIAGESGCGKSTIALSLMRLIKGGKIVDGKIMLNGVSLLDLPEKEFNAIRWDKISFVSQAAMGALNPVYTIGAQIVEAILAHRKIKKSDALNQVRELLRKVEIDPDRVSNYPHELSGGMRQRAMIAMALALNPEVLIADEPTTALDVVTQAQMIKLLKKLQKEMNLAVIFISHDLSILAQVCDKILIMYAGKAKE